MEENIGQHWVLNRSCLISATVCSILLREERGWKPRAGRREGWREREAGRQAGRRVGEWGGGGGGDEESKERQTDRQRLGEWGGGGGSKDRERNGPSKRRELHSSDFLPSVVLDASVVQVRNAKRY